MLRAFKYRIDCSKTVEDKFINTLSLCLELYNAALTERREAYKLARLSITYLSQANQLPEIKSVRDDLKTVHSQILQQILKRLDKAFSSFFQRVKNGQKAGFPRY